MYSLKVERIPDSPVSSWTELAIHSRNIDLVKKLFFYAIRNGIAAYLETFVETTGPNRIPEGFILKGISNDKLRVKVIDSGINVDNVRFEHGRDWYHVPDDLMEFLQIYWPEAAKELKNEAA